MLYNKNCKFVVFGITDFTFDKGIELINIENDLPQCTPELMHKIHTLAS